MSVRSGSADIGGRHLVVCCASGDRAALEPALDVLAARGFQATVFEGAQPHTPALLEHVRRHGPASIYVLAKSTSLHAPRMARMMTVLECADIAPEQVVELDIDWRDPMALVEKVEAVPRTVVPAQALPPPPPPPPPPSALVSAPRSPTLDGLRTATASMRPIVRATGGWITQSRSRMVGAGAGVVALVALTITVLSLGGDEDADAVSPTVVAMPASADAADDAPTPALEADPPIQIDEAPEPEGAPAVAGAPPSSRATTPARRRGTHAGIVYAPLHPPKRDFHAAVAQCEAMNAAGEGGWRLPTLGEMHTLAVGHVVDRGVYWSGTESDGFGKQALVWSEKKSRAAPVGKKWRGARAVCVKAERAEE